MLAQNHWSHAEWKQDDEKRLQFTLGFSILLHLVLLLAWKLPPQVWKVADHAVLTVVLRAAAPLPPSTQAPEKKQDVAVLVQKDPAPATFSVPPKTLVAGTVAPAVAHPQLSLAATPARVAVQPTPGRPSNAAPAPVGVTVMLAIGEDGRVQQIYWDQLPALTDEQLRRVETAIRSKTYASRQTISEIIDVRGILKLPPVRSEDNPASVTAAE
jgi:hypothetical protein